MSNIPRPVRFNRRSAARFEPVRREARLSWRADDAAPGLGRSDASHPTAAGRGTAEFGLLLDISLAGASLAVDRVPDGDRTVWLRLQDEGAPEWSEAVVVDVTPTARGPHLIRLAFRSPCPIDTIRAAVDA